MNVLLISKKISSDSLLCDTAKCSISKPQHRHYDVPPNSKITQAEYVHECVCVKIDGLRVEKPRKLRKEGNVMNG